METEDIPRVYELANQIHTLYESIDIFVERQRLCPQGCFVLGDCVGYVISHPYTKDSPPLNTLVHKIPDESTCWYIHDLVISAQYRRQGYASTIVERIACIAKKHYNYLTLTSVNGSELFWKKHGFEIESMSSPTYGSSCYMVKPI
jgi:ribosomal protein S18 acetylase RimI-like enzyme